VAGCCRSGLQPKARPSYLSVLGPFLPGLRGYMRAPRVSTCTRSMLRMSSPRRSNPDWGSLGPTYGHPHGPMNTTGAQRACSKVKFNSCWKQWQPIAYVMAQRKSLTQAQLDLLEWIADDCPDGIMEGFDHHVSAAALRRRGLVRITGRGATWQATITDAGKEYLAKSKEPGAEPPRQANVSVTEELIRNVEAAGGVLRVKEERGPGSVNWSARVRAAIEHGKVPAGKKLSCRWDDMAALPGRAPTTATSWSP
jgi:hypothetical protein